MDLNNAFNYDITEQSFNKLALRYNEYVEHYADFIAEYAEKCDGSEKSYIEYELEVFEESVYYLEHLDTDKYPNDFRVYQFELEFKPFLKQFRAIMLLNLNTICESNECKCEFLRDRLTELSYPKRSFTLNQRLLLIKYFDRLRIIKLEKISQDQTAQAQFFSFLMNSSYQKTRAALGKNIDEFKTEKDLKVLIDLLTPYKSSFQAVLNLIIEDFNKIR